MADNEFCDLADQSRHFTINILAQQHVDLAMVFAGLSGDESADRFESGDWQIGANGAPRLEDSLVSLECEIDSAMNRGTHRIYIGKVVDVHESAGQPLVYTARGFASTAPLAD